MHDYLKLVGQRARGSLPTAFTALLLGAGTLLGQAGTAAAGFFDTCLAPGSQTIEVHQNTVVRNETATFNDPDFNTCSVELDAGVALTLVHVTINAVQKGLTFSGPATASVSIRRSDLGACDSDVSGVGSLVIYKSTLNDPAAGCDGKELEISGDIKVIDSTLTATESFGYMQLFSDLGRVMVFNSKLIAPGGVEIGAFSPTQVASICRNDISTESNTAISSAGKTVVRNNDVTGTATLTGSPCISIGNSPGVVCPSTCRGTMC